MKKSFTVFLLLFVAAVLFYAPEPASADIYFTLSNESGRTFKEIWVGPSSNEKWLERDRFENRDGSITSLRSGYHVELWPNMNGRQDVRYWDIKVVTPDGRKHEYHNIDMYIVNHIEIDRSYEAHYSR
ncbi:MAG: hypothetical protein II877_10910 [Synergistaceae bacterium]|nr:hypothetical protein [Synergistaceae bacterium]MBQ6972496.1 hypothetical protein [Synergistaceae bacterium]